MRKRKKRKVRVWDVRLWSRGREPEEWGWVVDGGCFSCEEVCRARCLGDLPFSVDMVGAIGRALRGRSYSRLSFEMGVLEWLVRHSVG